MKQTENRQHSGKSSPAQVWKSWVGWRTSLMVFGIVFLIQMVVCIVMIHVYEIEQLAGLREVARSSLVSAIHDPNKQNDPPLLKQEVKKLIDYTMIEGLAVYGMDYTVIGAYGAPLVLHPGVDKKNPGSYRTVDDLHYEVTFPSNEIGHPYNILARLDASDVTRRVALHTRQAVRILFLISVFVTSILLLALNQLLLAPIIKRNDDLLRQVHTQAEDRIRKLAYFDSLTGLPNRTYFLEHLEENIKRKMQGKDDALAVLSVDIDHFKDVNDAMGHEVGDKLLEVVARRLVQTLPSDAIVARSSADEFSVMVFLKPDQPDSAQLADKIFSAILEPIEIMRENFLMRASIGVSHYPHDGSNASEIMKNADIALNRAKTEGRSTVRHYSHDFNLVVQQRAKMLRDLRKALEQKQLQLYYHPQFDLRSGQIVGVEALLRWFRPDESKEGGKFISPAEFIPVAEQSGLIVPIGEYVLRTACATAKSWQERGMAPIRMAVNISGIQFHRSDLVSLVADVLKETNLDPKWLELELTESVFIEDTQAAIDILDQLHQLGVELAVDDFGTGYSSLSYLRQFPIDRLKIDQSFVRSSLLNLNDRMIIRAIINLGHSLDLKIIAEGVEMKDHEDLLKEEGCDEAQGFKYSKPIPAEKFWDFSVSYNESLVKNNKTWMVD